MVLLLSMIRAIVLTFRQREAIKRQSYFRQIPRERKDGVELVEPKNKKLLSNGICEMLNLDDEKRTEIGLNGRKKIEKEYPIKLICEKYFNLYSLISCGDKNYENI